MDLFGIGIWEIVFIMVLALIVMGPRDLEKVGRSIGSFLRKVIVSQEWRLVRDTSEQIRKIPTRLMRDAAADMQETEAELRKVGGDFQESLKEIGSTAPASGARKQTPVQHAKPAPQGPAPVRIPQGKSDPHARISPSVPPEQKESPHA